MKKFLLLLASLLTFATITVQAQQPVFSKTYVNASLDTVVFAYSVNPLKISGIDTLVTKVYPYKIPVPPSQVYFDVPTIPATDDVPGFGRGLNNFFGKQTFSYSTPLNYYRFSWAQLQPDVNNYNWADFDAQIRACMNAGTQFTFRVGILDNTAIGGYININGSKACYPLFVHNLMQSEAVKDWASGSTWYPNWNSQLMNNAWETFLKELAKHISTAGFGPAIFSQDVGFFGNFLSEWNNYGIDDKGHNTVASDATLIRAINSYATIFPNMWLVLNQATFDTRYCSDEVALAAIQAKNLKGLMGFRCDHVAWYNVTANDKKMMNRTYKGVNFLTEIQKRRNYAPCMAEPMNDVAGCTPAGGTPYQTLIDEVNYYGFSTISNEPTNAPASAKTNFLNSARASGYRWQVDSGSYISYNGGLVLKLNYSSTGIAPVYDSYTTNLELRNGTTVVWQGVSLFNPVLFSGGKVSITDNFSSIQAGNYSLYISLTDPAKYKKPLCLANKNRGIDGSYFLTSITIK